MSSLFNCVHTLILVGMKARDKTDDQIEDSLTKVRKNRKVRQDQSRDGAPFIIWGADDENLHKFILHDKSSEEDGEKKEEEEQKEQKVLTVQRYFKERWGLNLKFPKMPIVFVGMNEWYPIEFIFQRFGKMKAANESEQIKAVLDYYNEHKGSRYISNVTEVRNMARQKLSNIGLSEADALQMFNLRRSNEPVQLEARILPEPTLRFKDTNARLKDGDWAVMRDKRGIKFAE